MRLSRPDLTSAQMRLLDRNSEYIGVSALQLMENAGRAVASEIASRYRETSSIAVFVGTGRNGGDGMVAARHLASLGFKVTVLLFGSEAAIKDEIVSKNWKALKAMKTSIRIEVISDSSEVPPIDCEVAVDALLGTGAKGSLRQPILRGVEAFNRLKCRKVAVDLPTGVNSDTGEIMGEAVKADLTVTFHAKKIGLAKVEDLCGEIVVADIGIPPEAELYAGPGDVELVTRPRPPESHKGQFGRLLIIGGSETYVGAPALVGLAALRAGVDLAFVAAPEKTALAIATHSPDLITIRLPGDYLKSEAVKLLEDQIDRASAVAIGPGLGLRSETVSAVKELVQVLSRSKKPSLLDADALKAIGPVHDPLGFPAVVTPHAGEFAALSGSMPSKDLHSRMEEVRSLAMKIGGTVLLKGHVDVISDGSRIKLNWTGNPGMTVGGTGDVLSGIVACFLAQGSDGFEASVAGAFINGAAGDLALSKYGFHLIPTDLIDLIPQVMNDPMSHRELRRQPLNGPIFSE